MVSPQIVYKKIDDISFEYLVNYYHRFLEDIYGNIKNAMRDLSYKNYTEEEFKKVNLIEAKKIIENIKKKRDLILSFLRNKYENLSKKFLYDERIVFDSYMFTFNYTLKIFGDESVIEKIKRDLNIKNDCKHIISAYNVGIKNDKVRFLFLEKIKCNVDLINKIENLKEINLTLDEIENIVKRTLREMKSTKIEIIKKYGLNENNAENFDLEKLKKTIKQMIKFWASYPSLKEKLEQIIEKAFNNCKGNMIYKCWVENFKKLLKTIEPEDEYMAMKWIEDYGSYSCDKLNIDYKTEPKKCAQISLVNFFERILKEKTDDFEFYFLEYEDSQKIDEFKKTKRNILGENKYNYCNDEIYLTYWGYKKMYNEILKLYFHHQTEDLTLFFKKGIVINYKGNNIGEELIDKTFVETLYILEQEGFQLDYDSYKKLNIYYLKDTCGLDKIFSLL